MNDIFSKERTASNREVDWGKIYDFYEITMRDLYQTISKPQNDSHFEMLKTKARNFLKKDKVFCEIGFSAGLTLRHALKYFGEVHGLDISSKNVECTGKELSGEGFTNFKLFASDILQFDSSFENKFDVISFIHGLEHFGERDYPTLLKNIKRYLKNGGVFSGALPYKNEFKMRMCPNCSHVFETDGHISSHDINSLKKVFEANDFKILHISSFNLKYYLSKERGLNKLLKLIYYFLRRKSLYQQIEYIVTPL
jgi:cyclopropane fatty-acyl-phospholipid synthase-like methyltransferase